VPAFDIDLLILFKRLLRSLLLDLFLLRRGHECRLLCLLVRLVTFPERLPALRNLLARTYLRTGTLFLLLYLGCRSLLSL
jgi:hypothetical protein